MLPVSRVEYGTMMAPLPPLHSKGPNRNIECRTKSSCEEKQVRIFQRQFYSSETAHGNPYERSLFAIRRNRKTGFHVFNQVLNYVVLVAITGTTIGIGIVSIGHD